MASRLDVPYSVSLGTNSTSPFSLSFQKGFLGLMPFSSANSNIEPPPLDHWTRDRLQMSRIKRIFPLTEVLDAAPAVTGVVLLFKTKEFRWLVSPALPHQGYTKDLGGEDWEKCCGMLLGFQELKIKYFPAVSFRDYRGAKRIYWKANGYVELLYGKQTASLLARAVAVTGDVCLEIERRSPSYPRNLEKYRDAGITWMGAVLRRLPRTLDKAGHLKTAPQFDDEKNTEESFEDVQAAPEPDDLPPSHRSTSRFLPAHTSLRWSSQELSLVDLDQAISHNKAYEAYLKSCSVLMIAARTFHAFKQKILKMFECQ
ncbi:unnamed protein product [Leuciscus chuanchicus]